MDTVPLLKWQQQLNILSSRNWKPVNYNLELTIFNFLKQVQYNLKLEGKCYTGLVQCIISELTFLGKPRKYLKNLVFNPL